jgi:hypothetical protein
LGQRDEPSVRFPAPGGGRSALVPGCPARLKGSRRAGFHDKRVIGRGGEKCDASDSPRLHTRALDLAHGDVRKVRRFSRHAKLETLLKYDDNRVDEAGAIARMLGEDSERTE